MYLSIKGILKNEKGMVDTIPGAAAIVKRFNSRMERAEKHWYLYDTYSEGATLDKEVARKALVKQTIEYNAILIAFATVTDQDVWAKELGRIPIRLISAGAPELIKKAGKVHQLLSDNLEGISPWQITAGTVAAFGKQIEAFGEKKKMPRLNIEARSANRLKAEALMDEIKKDLEKLDKLVACAPPACSEFSSTYTANRKAQKPRTTKMSFLGRVLLGDTLEPAVGAIAILSLGNRKYKVTPTGQLRIKNIKEGAYTLTLSYPGYAGYTVKIYPSTGSTIRMEIVLVPVADLQQA